MVICDMDHPDIEEFINWKVIEEQKVASLVAGSKDARGAAQRHLRRDPGLGWRSRGSPPIRRPTRAEGRDPRAKKARDPRTYVKRVLDYARQGYGAIEFPTYDTDWDSEAYGTVSGQNSNNSVRVTDAFLKAVEDDAIGS
jgi:ribonucleoside-diphosphate reductase alpha chain